MDEEKPSLQSIEDDFKSLTETVYERLKSAIVKEELGPGTRMSERDLSAQLGVSSTTVKRALQRLQGEGFVEIRPRRGTYVSQSLPAMEENTVMRAYLEGLAARFAALKASDEDFQEMRLQIETMRERTAEGVQSKIVEANTRFHSLVHLAARNPYIGRLIGVLRNFDRQFRDRAISDHAEAVRGFEEHKAVMEAIVARDGELAEERMKKHILRTLDFVKGEMKKAEKGEAPSPTDRA